MSTDLKERFEGVIDGDTVVSVYRAFAEDDKPYCIHVSLPDVNLFATFQPTEVDEYTTAEEAEAIDRQNAAKWVQVLTSLVEKAKNWDDLQDSLEEAEELAAADSPYQVDKLTDDCSDLYWVDREGDVYKFDGGQWWVTTHIGSSNFELVGDHEGLLTNYGPYTAIPSPEFA
ncbi:hypothetical protein SEA_REINDEER_51 [Mycobacterium phage Reindeer]|uniref:Uncharacterized protein n=1 Tax=Mycobacterium phage Reindeer TaxID=2762283 RepID=A0A7G8LHY9_9CAUD|nr:hypothetical protein J4U05_gp051 [Mycobacterium phage Reindeer]QNJ56861.1 hypothetical protein SEA_REINDEER_51 [Mycobacterium phage Reindeer]